MGKNYYIYISPEDVYKECEKLHIGKSSAGWVFSLRVHRDRGINTLYDWLPIILNNQNIIRDEYGTHIQVQYLLETITCRKRDKPVTWTDSDWSMNNAEPGPNNLVRSREYGGFYNGRVHGEGTWDYCDYDFF